MDLKQAEDIPLSDKDIVNKLNNQVKIVLYPDLHQYSTIDEVMGPHEACVLLFESKPNYGHWTCIWKLNDKTVSFYNPYGGYPDDSLEYISDDFKKKSHQDEPVLSNLLLNSPYELTYNDKEYQKHAQNIKTCGRHCIVRLLLRNMTDEMYDGFMKDCQKQLGLSPDEVVTIITI